MFDIEKDVPLIGKAGSGRTEKYPWSKMEIGDSFFVPGMKLKNISNSGQNAQKSLGYKYAIRTVDGGVRIWRVA
jgi:hypothetical protein